MYSYCTINKITSQHSYSNNIATTIQLDIILTSLYTIVYIPLRSPLPAQLL